MRSRATVAFAGVVALGIAALALSAWRDDRDLSFTLGVAATQVAVEIPAGAEACQTPVAVSAPFDGVRLQLGTFQKPGPPLDLTVRPVGGSETFATGRLAAGYPDVSQQEIELTREVRRGARVKVCLRNRGQRRVAVYGGPAAAKRASSVELDGQDTQTDLLLVFTTEPQSVVSELSDVFDRAALFRPSLVGAWTFWLLLALILIAAPVALATALRRAFADEVS